MEMSLVVVITLLILGLCVSIHLVCSLRRQAAAQQWPATTGKILVSTMSQGDESWFPKICYGYTVHGEDYTTEQLHFYVTTGKTKAVIQRLLSNYPVGRSVPVYYNPRKPTEAVLDRRFRPIHHLFWLIAAIVLIASSVIIFLHR
jgi:Protein of unknown function (DUF3592)